MKFQGRNDSVIDVVKKECGEYTVIKFANFGDMLNFCGYQIYLLGTDLFCEIGWQYLTEETYYTYKFKTVDFEKYIQRKDETEK